MADQAQWATEILHDHWRQSLAVDRVVWEGQSQFQRIRVFENHRFGRVLMLDDVVQTAERGEHVYHEMLVHVPVLSHGEVETILIVGGADGGVLREALRHPVRKVTMVDIDGEVVARCREHLPTLSAGAFDDPRTDLRIGDGARFVAETDDRYDVIIVDSTDPVGPGAVLFDEPFYSDCRRILTPAGILVTQNGVPFAQGAELRNSYRHFHTLFRFAGCYVAPVPFYIGGFMALGHASNGPRMGTLPDPARASQISQATRYYNADIHNACFALPNFVRTLLAEP